VSPRARLLLLPATVAGAAPALITLVPNPLVLAGGRPHVGRTPLIGILFVVTAAGAAAAVHAVWPGCSPLVRAPAPAAQLAPPAAASATFAGGICVFTGCIWDPAMPRVRGAEAA
jgi:hypothetical protein